MNHWTQITNSVSSSYRMERKEEDRKEFYILVLFDLSECVFTHLNSWCAIEKLKAKWFRNAENMNCFRFNTAAAAEDFHARITQNHYIHSAILALIVMVRSIAMCIIESDSQIKGIDMLPLHPYGHVRAVSTNTNMK